MTPPSDNNILPVSPKVTALTSDIREVCVCVHACVMRILLQAVEQLHQTRISLQLNCKYTKYLYCTYVNNPHNLNIPTEILQSCKKTEIPYAEIVFLITKNSTETLT